MEMAFGKKRGVDGVFRAVRSAVISRLEAGVHLKIHLMKRSILMYKINV
jgi:hypothetical protein